MEVYGDQVYGNYLQVENLADNWSEILAYYHVKTLMLTPGDRLSLLLPGRGWKLAYRDDVAAVYTHD